MNALDLCRQILIRSRASPRWSDAPRWRVQPVTAENRIEHICIQENPKVQVGDFVTVMQEGFQSHGITSQLVHEQVPAGCITHPHTPRRRTWDMAMYMTDAQIEILRTGADCFCELSFEGQGGFASNNGLELERRFSPS
jgi:hypothetical protein